MVNLDNLFGSSPDKSSGLIKFQFGWRGVVGKLAYVALGAMVVLIFVAHELRDPTLLFILAVMAMLLFVIFLGGVLWLCSRHPQLALLEGAEIIQYRQLDMASKGDDRPPQGPNTEPPPLIEGPSGK
jgi:hypothetical protein